MRLFAWLRARLNGPEFEPEYEEDVDHDTVIVDGKAISEGNPRADDPQDSPPEARASACGVARGGKGADRG